ncbi:hypothetical protein Q8A67_022304 [Cirrhinus molitorella]|uniref:Uncharacterized protein n=1 Tax=Cirrhinus molitorella TaxID=172907 RepID=A0AA88P1L7_9TELE|nr:hypothetical protein Q8A67_022304 [Cirrhinus molitorella]
MEISEKADEREWLMGRETQPGWREERRAGLSRLSSQGKKQHVYHGGAFAKRNEENGLPTCTFGAES